VYLLGDVADAVDEADVVLAVHELARLAVVAGALVAELVADLRGLRGPVGDRLAFGVLEAALLAVAAVAIVAERAADLRHGGAVDNCC
jgi:hypothetical protein